LAEFDSDGSEYGIAVAERAVTEAVAAIIGTRRTYLLCYHDKTKVFTGTTQERLDHLAAEGVDITADPWASGYLDERSRWDVIGSDATMVNWIKAQPTSVLETDV